MAAPPTIDNILELLQLTTPEDYHQPFLDDPAALAQYRGWARAFAELAKIIGRSASRQLFLTGPDREPAGFSTRATMKVVLRRTEGLDRPLTLGAGSLTLEGPRGRVYRNIEPLIWYGFDPQAELTATLRCDLIGEYGNLDYLADADGYLTDPITGGPALRLVDVQRLSQGRAGIHGALELGEDGEPSRLTDSGAAPTFGPDDVGLYLRITYAGDTANIGRVLRIVGYETDDLEQSDETYPRTILIDDTPQPELVTAAIQDDGGVLTHYTDEARNRTADDLPLLPATPAAGDAIYFASDKPFVGLRLFVTSELIGDAELVWEVWDGSWTAVDVEDPSEGLRRIGEHDLVLGDTTGWTTTTVDSIDGYHLRARVDSVTTQTNQPKAALAVVLIEQPLVADPLDSLGRGQIGWTILDWRDLGVQIVSMTAPADGREDDLGLKLLERGLSRRPGESVAMLRRRAARFPDVVTPEAIGWEVNRILEPLGLCGRVLDLGDGFSGLFWDVPADAAPLHVGAWDLYGDGEPHPIDTTFLPLSDAEARWHFWVLVPPGTLGEFGAAWDDGPPPLYVEQLGQFVGSAWDEAFVDGYAYVSAALYKRVYEVVRDAKAAGITFTMIRGSVACCA